MGSANKKSIRRAERPAPCGGALSFLYKNPVGRALLALLVCPAVSAIGGAYMRSPLSRGRIKRFIAANGIDMSDFEGRRFTSFNDFFTRRIKPGRRTVDTNPAALCAPCDSRLSVYPVSHETSFEIKNSRYSVTGMLGDAEAARAFDGGWAMVFRLAVDDYHRLCFFDTGRKGISRFIRGKLHTVQPIATECGHDIFTRNCRSVSLLETESFGRAAMCYIGALMVGRIEEHHPEEYAFVRGEEAGFFSFGGSTLVLLLPPGSAEPDPELVRATSDGMETRVKYGERIGRSLIYGK